MAEDAGEEGARSPAEGVFVSLGDEGWQTFRVAVGEVLEFFVTKSDGGMDFPIRCAVIVTEVKDNNGQIGYFGRFIGSEDAGTNRELGNTINHRDRGVHFCQGDPCDALEGTWAAHMSRGRWWSMKNFPREYLKVWGLSVLEEGIRIGYPGEGVKPPDKPRSRGDPAKKKPPAPGKERPRRPVSRGKKPAVEPAATSGRRPPAGKDPEREALRVKLNTLKERLIGDRREATEDVIEVEESEDGADLSEDSGFVAEKTRRKSALGTGSNLNPNESRLALRDLDDLEDSKGNTLKRPFRVKKEKKEKKALVVKKSRSKRSSLLAMAEQREEEMRKRKVSLQKKKRKVSLVRGKGFGSAAFREEKEGKDQGWGQQPLQQWIFNGWRHGGRGVVIRERGHRPLEEEVAEAPRFHLEDAGISRHRSVGPISSGGDGQHCLSDRGHENGYLLQPPGEAQLQPGEPRFEGDAFAGDLHRSTSKRTIETSGRLPQCQVCGPPLRSGGGLLGSCEASGTPSFGASPIGSHGGPSESKETCQADPKESRRRRRLQPIKGWRLMEFLERRRRLARWRKRKRQGRKRKGWSERKRKRQWMEAERLERLEREESRLVEEPEGVKGFESREGKGVKEWLGEAIAGAEATDYDGGEEAPRWRDGFRDLRRIAESGKSLKGIGCMLCWLVLAATTEAEKRRFSRGVWSILGGLDAGSSAVHRLPKKGVFPIRLGGLASMAYGGGIS